MTYAFHSLKAQLWLCYLLSASMPLTELSPANKSSCRLVNSKFLISVRIGENRCQIGCDAESRSQMSDKMRAL